MTLQFYIGSAGSGKSFSVMEDIADELRRDASPRSGRLYLLLPEQATAQAESALLNMAGVEATSRAMVISFRRLADMVLSETGGAPQRALDEQGRQMLLRALLGRHREELKVFGRSSRQSGFLGRLSSFLGELAQFRHNAADLAGRYRELEKSGEAESLFGRKLHDLALVARLWEEHLGESMAAGDRLLTTLAERIGDSGLMDGARVWIDGFASFMPQEQSVLREIIGRAESVKAALLLGPERLGELSAGGRIDPMRLFAQSEETWAQLGAIALELGVEIEEPVVFPAQGQATRFSDCPALEQVERGLRESSMFEGQDVESAMESAVGRLPEVWEPVTLMEAPSERDEVEAVARCIRRLARDEGHRYRDMAIVARDLSNYAPHIRAVFSRYGIPFFLDERRPIAHHPLVRLLGAALRSVEGDWRYHDMLDFLKNDLALVDRASADRIENLALRRGWRGRGAWVAELTEDNAGMESERARALGPLAELDEALSGGEGIAAKDFASAVTAFLEAMSAPERMGEWTAGAREAGRLDEAEEHVQAWEGVVALLREVVTTLGNEALSLEEWVDVLDTGLDGLTLGLVPPALDQVLVGTVERSRQPELRVAFVMGLNEGVFPRSMQPDPILNDDERRRLQEHYGMELSATSEQRLFQERYLGYVALTRASQRLVASWSSATAKGTRRAPSVFAGRLLRACGGEAALVRLERGWSGEDALTVESSDDVDIFLARGTGEALRDFGSGRERLKAPSSNARVNAEALGEALMPSGRQVSISRLETYNKCPFQYYAKYVLGLDERKLHRINVLDMGRFYHGALERVFLELAGEDASADRLRGSGFSGLSLDWGAVDERAAFAALDGALEAAADELTKERELSQEERSFYVERSRRTLGTVLKGMIEMGGHDVFRQAGAEVRFGYRDAMDGLRLEPADGGAVELRGVIDRVDVADMDGALGVRVIDFKSSLKKLDVDEVAAGLALQLPLYMLVVTRALGDVVPIGVFFMDLRRSLQDTNAPGESSDVEEPIRLSGKFDLDYVEALTTIDSSGKARHVALKLKKDGEPSKVGSDGVLQGMTLRQLSEGAKAVAELTAGDIRSGCFEVRPQGVKSPCEWCAYSDFCRIDVRRTRVQAPEARVDFSD